MKITIIGSGVYGSATAKMLNNSGNDVTVWTEKENIDEIIIGEGIKVTNKYEDALKDAKLVYVLTAAKYAPSIFEAIKNLVRDDMTIILGSKGILENGGLMEDVLLSVIPKAHYAVVSGPTFAHDIGELEPLGFTVATHEKDRFDVIKSAYKGIKIEYSQDTTGTELCGVLKNAYAIGSGMLNGFNYGPSIRSLYITSVLNEMKKILKSMDANIETAYTLAGIGDLILTCTSNNSRNFTFGTILASNDREKTMKYLEETTVEGYENMKVLSKLFEEKSIDAPILNMLYEIVRNGRNSKDIIPFLVD